MNYYSARPLIRSGDVLAWNGTGLVDKLIKFATKSFYSHCGIAWVVGDRVFVIEAVEPMVRIYPLSKKVPFYWIPVTPYWDEEIEKIALSRVGDKYSILAAVKGYLNTLRVGSDNSWQCAELVISVLKAKGVFNTEVQPTPAAVVETLQRQGFDTKYVNT